MAKFVSAKRVSHYAQDLFAMQQRKEQLRAELKQIEEQEEFLQSFLRRKYPEGFNFASTDGYEMNVAFADFERRMLNQAKAKKMLGDKTPYTKVIVHKTKIDYVYEDQ